MKNFFLIDFFKSIFKRKDSLFFLIVLLIFNIPLLFGKNFFFLSYVPSKVLSGELWRIFTYAFVHVNFYHFLFDSITFIILYSLIKEKSIFKRLMYIFFCILGNLVLSHFGPVDISAGLCGLSGIDHGLILIVVLEGLFRKENKDLRLISFLFLIFISIKVFFEIYFGKPLFGYFYLDYIKNASLWSHLGGFLGGLLGFIVLNVKILFKN